MNLEIHGPELVQRVNAHIQTGHFHDADEVLERALDALEGRSPAPSSGHAAKPGGKRTGADAIAALQASPYRELDIEPTRFRLSMPVRDVTFRWRGFSTPTFFRKFAA
jgi:Arc/MetJ-type ribon-helix-helix transcriptional regulator